MKRRAPVKRRNVKRRTAEWTRAYGPRLRWLKAWTCIAYASPATDCSGPIDAAHTASGGIGRKADASTLVPLCRSHHRELHQHGARTFEAQHHLNLAERAQRCDRAWQRHMEAP